MMKAMSSSAATNVFLVGFLVAGCIYPITVLILLNNPGAGRHCSAPSRMNPATFEHG